jgi:hypothetical protein
LEICNRDPPAREPRAFKLDKTISVAGGLANINWEFECQVVSGNPNPDYVSTSFVECQNLNMRMNMRRFTRLPNAFLKKVENHCHAIALSQRNRDCPAGVICRRCISTPIVRLLVRVKQSQTRKADPYS